MTVQRATCSPIVGGIDAGDRGEAYPARGYGNCPFPQVVSMDRRVATIVRRLDEAWRANQPRSELAAFVNLGSCQLAHLFRRDLGMSIRDYLRTRRLQEAARLLVETPLRVSEVCYLTGFGDPAGFSRTFRKAFGHCPREYRSGRGLPDVKAPR
jgi:transcriptional regulator GlxA family with amidase domain